MEILLDAERTYANRFVAIVGVLIAVLLVVLLVKIRTIRHLETDAASRSEKQNTEIEKLQDEQQRSAAQLAETKEILEDTTNRLDEATAANESLEAVQEEMASQLSQVRSQSDEYRLLYIQELAEVTRMKVELHRVWLDGTPQHGRDLEARMDNQVWPVDL